MYCDPYDNCSKILMRWTVLSSDALIFFPAAFAFAAIYYVGKEFNEFSWGLMMIMLQPGLILIDHGHFQVMHIHFQSKRFSLFVFRN